MAGDVQNDAIQPDDHALLQNMSKINNPFKDFCIYYNLVLRAKKMVFLKLIVRQIIKVPLRI